MNILSIKQRHELLDRLQALGRLQNQLWQEASAVADELVGCKLDDVLEQVPEIALVMAGPGEDLTFDEVDKFLVSCRSIV